MAEENGIDATGGSRKGGAKFEVLFVLLVIFAFLAAYRLRETGVFDVPSSGSVFARISNQGMLDLINTTAAVPDRAERLRRIDTVVAVYGDDRTPHIDYGVTWMLAARAKEENTVAGKIAAYDVILRRYPSREGIHEERTAALLDWVEAMKASLTGDTEALRNVAERNAGASRQDQRHARMFALNKLGDATADVEAKRRCFDQAFAEYHEGDTDSDVLAQAATALIGKAKLAKGEERKALLSGMVERFQSSPGRYVREEALLWSLFSLALDAEPAERLGLFEKIVGEYKGGTSEYVQNELRKIVGRILTLARGRPDRAEILDRLAAELRGSASKPLAARVVMERAGMLSGDAEKADAYRAVVDEFKDTDDTSVREQVIAAARNLLKFSADKTAAAQVGWDVASLYESDTNGRVANRVAGMLGDVAGAVSGDAEKLAAWNRILEFAKRNPNPMNVSFLHDALEGKSGLEKDPDAAKRFFSEWIAGAGSDDELFRSLRMKLSYYRDRELVKEARGEIIAKFAGTRDAGQAQLVVEALDGLSWYAPWPFGNASDEEIRLYDSLIDRFAGAEDEAGLDVHMSALLGKATGIDDATAAAALCDRILAVQIPARAKSLERIRERAADLKSQMLGAPEMSIPRD